MSSSVSAVLLPLGAQVQCCMPLHAFAEYVTNAVRFLDVPHAPRHANRLYMWGEHMVPVVDLGVLLGAGQESVVPATLVIVKYTDMQRSVRSYGALQIHGEPQRIQVGDDMVCALPGASCWPLIAASCIKHEGRVAPILDLSAVFGDALAAFAATSDSIADVSAVAA